MTTRKTCNKCGVTKPETEYYFRSDGRRRGMCKGCYSVHNKEQRERHLDKRKAYDAERGSGWDRHPEGREKYAQSNEQRFKTYLKRVYDLDIEDYWQMHEDQGNVCAICHKEDPVNGKLSVDHDHHTGKVRGLLCFPCNTGIGKLGDSYETVQAAADYLKDNK